MVAPPFMFMKGWGTASPLPRLASIILGITNASRLRVASYEFRETCDPFYPESGLLEVTFKHERAKKLQIICAVGNEPADKVSQFDLDCVRAWFDPSTRKLHAHFDALESWFSRASGWRKRPTESRIIKCWRRGFSTGIYSERLLALMAPLDARPWLFDKDGWGVHRESATNYTRHQTVIVGDEESVALAVSRARESCPTAPLIGHRSGMCYRSWDPSLEVVFRLYFADVHIRASPPDPDCNQHLLLMLDADTHAAVRRLHQAIIGPILEKANDELYEERARPYGDEIMHRYLPDDWWTATREFEDSSTCMQPNSEGPPVINAFLYHTGVGSTDFGRMVREEGGSNARASVVLAFKCVWIAKPPMKIYMPAYMVEMKIRRPKRKRSE